MVRKRPVRKSNRLRRKSDVEVRHPSWGTKMAAGLQRWRAFKPYFLVAVLLMALPIIGVQTYRYFRANGHFTVQEIIIEGQTRLSAGEILAFAGIEEGMAILRLDEEQIKSEIQRHPRIRWAEVDVLLPNRVEIKIQERLAAAVVVMGRMYLADERGVIFKRVESGDDIDGLPMITGVAPGYLAKEETAGAAESIVREGIQLATAYAVHPVSRHQALGELHHDPLFGWTLVTVEDGMEVRLGAGSLAEKLDRFHHIVRDLATRGAEADVIRLDASRDPGRVAVRMQYVGGNGEGVVSTKVDTAVAPSSDPTTDKSSQRDDDKGEKQKPSSRVNPDFRGQILPQ